MKVIILAAGVGQRLGKAADNRPKCLLEFEGESLLRRHLKNLQDLPVDEIVIVTGYRQQAILDELKSVACKAPVTPVFNPDYRQGSAVSLWHARDCLAGGDEIILMDADVLYDPRILERLIRHPDTNCFLLDREFEPGNEPVKLCILGGVPIDFRKQIDEDLAFDFQGESVGFFRFSPAVAARLADRLEAYVSRNRRMEPYEEAIRDLLLETPEAFTYLDITGCSWIEIDFPEDIDRASTIIIKNMDQRENQ